MLNSKSLVVPNQLTQCIVVVDAISLIHFTCLHWKIGGIIWVSQNYKFFSYMEGEAVALVPQAFTAGHVWNIYNCDNAYVNSVVWYF